jgi:hypothetical protein
MKPENFCQNIYRHKFAYFFQQQKNYRKENIQKLIFELKISCFVRNFGVSTQIYV